MFGNKPGYDVFLGGTTNESHWRKTFLTCIETSKTKLKCFNPVVENWTEECIELENFVKAHAPYHVYVLTPKMIGCYSVAEMVESTINKNGKKVFFCILKTDLGENGELIHWEPHMINSLNAVSRMIQGYGAIKADNIKELVDLIIKDKESSPIIRSTFSKS